MSSPKQGPAVPYDRARVTRTMLHKRKGVVRVKPQSALRSCPDSDGSFQAVRPDTGKIIMKCYRFDTMIVNQAP